MDRRLILVSAGAGYGKTTLLVAFAHEVDFPVCWYALDESDADPRVFLDYILLSLRQRFPDFGRQTEALLSSVSDPAAEISSVVACLVNEIQDEIQDYFALVLDDFHRVDGSDTVNHAVDLLISYLPDNCHLIISTRTIPRLTFSRMAAQRQVAGLSTTDLRFTSEEIAAFLKTNFRIAMPEHQLEEAAEASEGWIAGILLTTHTPSMGMAQNLSRARQAGSPLFEYMAGEAFLLQPTEVQTFLTCSSVLPQMTPDLCDRLFAGGTARDTLDYLVSANLFTVAVEGPGEWHRYHNLFHEFLRARLRTEAPDKWTSLNRRAAALAEESGEWDQALTHLHSSGDSDQTAALIERVGEEMIRAGRWRTLHRWLEEFPDGGAERPYLGYLRGRACLWAGEIEKAVATLSAAAESFHTRGDSTMAGMVLNSLSVGLRVKGKLAEALAASRRALELQPEGCSPVSAGARRDIGICLASQGMHAEAGVALTLALESYRELGDVAGIASTSHAMGILSVRSGDLARGSAHYQEALAAWNRAGNRAGVAELLNCLGLVYYYTGEYARALPALEEALAAAKEGGYLRVEAACLGGLGDLHRDTGNLPSALDCYEAALELANRVEERQLVSYLLDALANAHRLMGDYSTAERLLRQALHRAEEAGSNMEVATYGITAGVLAEERGDLDRAISVLSSATSTLAEVGSRRDLARGRFHLARSYHSSGQMEKAAQELDGCLELCRQLGYDQFMVVEGQRASPLLAWASSRGLGGRRLQMVLDRLDRPTPASTPTRIPRMRIETSAPRLVEIQSFGSAQVTVDSRLVTSSQWAVERTRELFFYLLHQPQGARRDQIVEAIWPEADEGRGTSQLHSTLYRLRRAVFPQCVLHQNGRYQLLLGDRVRYDATEFGRLLDEAEALDGEPERQDGAYSAALELYRGPFLEEVYSDWAAPLRERHQSRFLAGLAALAKLRARAGRMDEALALLGRSLETDPYREETRLAFIHYCAISGNRASALRHYKSYSKLLREEFEAEPSQRVAELAARIASGRSLPPL